VVLVALVFAIIVIHELGHALMARRFGVHTRDILLLPIGGIASLERIPDRSAQELAIAVVGPAINVVLAGLIGAGIGLSGGSVNVNPTDSIGMSLAVRLFWINLVLAGFNLLPAFPLDGGRALRALLALWMPREKATTIAAGLGKALAAVFAVVGLLYNPWLVLIAVVVWFGARHEAELVRLRSSLSGVPASAAMLRRVDTVTLDDSLENAASLMTATGSPLLPIVEQGRTVGVLTPDDIRTGLDRAGPEGSVADAPAHGALTFAPNEPLDRVLDRLQSDPDAIGVVVDHEAPVGSHVGMSMRRDLG
jgi:Zn-dependent protease/CBS domain-containing protein